MQLINYGSTNLEGIVEWSKIYNRRIITYNEERLKELKKCIEEFGYDIPEPYAIKTYMKLRIHDDGVVVDDLNKCLEVLIGTVRIATTSNTRIFL